ncbi:MAG: hypothetical protein ACRC1Z_15760 [Waterburya sp.]
MLTKKFADGKAKNFPDSRWNKIKTEMYATLTDNSTYEVFWKKGDLQRRGTIGSKMRDSDGCCYYTVGLDFELRAFGFTERDLNEAGYATAIPLKGYRFSSKQTITCLG